VAADQSTPVVLDSEPWEAIGRAGRARLVVALVRRGPVSTLLGLDPEVLTVAGHITWANTSDSRVGEVQDMQLREDRAERGIGLVLCRAAQELVGVGAWTGATIRDSDDNTCSLQAADAISGRRPDAIVDLVDGSSAAPEAHVVFRREASAAVVALADDTLAWIGHLAWTITRPGGRLDGPQAGLKVGEVQRVDTRDGFRGRGVAERMYRRAQRVAAEQGWPAEIDHNPGRTAFGEPWAAKVGGWRPALAYGAPLPEFEDMRRLFGG
jgi:GNAT superfamily N-acetyltransferase